MVQDTKWIFLEINVVDGVVDGAKTRYVFPFKTCLSNPILNDYGDISYEITYRNKIYKIDYFHTGDTEKEIVKKLYDVLCYNIGWHDFEKNPGNAPAINWKMLVVKSHRYIEKLKNQYLDLYPECFI